MDINEFLQAYHPEINKEYQRYLRRDSLPKVGSKVRTLRSGFGGYAGVIRQVVELTSNGIVLGCGEDRFLSNKKDWWMELEVISE